MTDQHPHRNGSWRNALIGAFGGICMLFGGWMLNEAATERRSLNTIANNNRTRIAVLEKEVESLTQRVTALEQGKR